ncbi:MAG: hypothetical protein ACOYL5_19890 [Phototrophicaceae bacterium]
MRPQKYPVVLSEIEQAELQAVIKRGKHTRREIQRAQMLLWSAAGETDLEIAELLQVDPLTVFKPRKFKPQRSAGLGNAITLCSRHT